ncbi:MAG: hypothetical protein FWE77_06315, partial [Clostridia bacterium]|nr:hypothetical protein [Clostridia bacterium]
WRQFRTKLPFAVGVGAGIAAIALVGSGNMLLVAVGMVVCLMIALRAKLTAALAAQDACQNAGPEETA